MKGTDPEQAADIAYITAELPATPLTLEELAIAREFPGVFTDRPALISVTAKELQWLQGEEWEGASESE